MATRYYPALKTPGVVFHGPMQGDWYPNNGMDGPSPASPVQWTWQLSQLNTDCGTRTNKELHTNQQGNFYMGAYRWVTPPLEAQTLSGTLNLCFRVQARWDDVSGFSDESVVRYSLHAYIAQGQTPTVRTTIINNYHDTVNFPGISGGVWQSLNTAQNVAGAVSAGDVIVIELGFTVVSSPTPTPTYPPSATTRIDFQAVGANAAFLDAVAGNTSTSLNGWIEFSATLSEQAAPAAPANDACVDAIVIPPTLPYLSDWINSTTSTDTEFGMWWTWTAPASGRVCVHMLGSNYPVQLSTFSGSCAGLVGVTANPADGSTEMSAHRSLSYKDIDVVSGTQYFFRVRADPKLGYAAETGGSIRLGAFYQNVPAEEDDLVIPSIQVVVMRDGQYLNIDQSLHLFLVTGVAFDYSHTDLDGNTSDRLLIGLHADNVVYANDWPIIDLLSLNAWWGSTSFPTPVFLDHVAQIAVTQDGILHTAWFGDGYLYVLGVGSSLSASYNAVSDTANWSQLKSVPSDDTDAVATYRTLGLGAGAAPWAIAIDQQSNILYYSTGGFYVPIPGSQTVHRYDLTNNVQLPDFATLVERDVDSPGIKGMCVISGEDDTFGGLLVCNGDVVQRLTPNGVLARTYTPSIAMDSTKLVDVRLKADGQSFLVIDLLSTRVFEFDITTGEELDTFQPYLETGTLVQMALYQPWPDGPSGPEPIPGGAANAGHIAPSPSVTVTTPIRRLRQFLLPSSPDNKNVVIPTLELLMRTGVGTTDGQGADPQVMMSLSKDGGKTWGPERWVSAGVIGRYTNRVRWTRATGNYRNAVCRIVLTDPVDWQLLGMLGDPQEGSS